MAKESLDIKKILGFDTKTKSLEFISERTIHLIKESNNRFGDRVRQELGPSSLSVEALGLAAADFITNAIKTNPKESREIAENLGSMLDKMAYEGYRKDFGFSRSLVEFHDNLINEKAGKKVAQVWETKEIAEKPVILCRECQEVIAEGLFDPSKYEGDDPYEGEELDLGETWIGPEILTEQGNPINEGLSPSWGGFPSTGSERVPCPKCKGQLKVDCPDCIVPGESRYFGMSDDCKTCRGLGTVPCPKCQKDAPAQTRNEPEEEPAPAEDNRPDKFICDDCLKTVRDPKVFRRFNGYKYCPTCINKGRYLEEAQCPTCGGSGEVPDEKPKKDETGYPLLPTVLDRTTKEPIRVGEEFYYYARGNSYLPVRVALKDKNGILWIEFEDGIRYPLADFWIPSQDTARTEKIKKSVTEAMTPAEAEKIVGGGTAPMSYTTKMPGPSFSMPAGVTCNMGRKLGDVEGSVCEKCYANALAKFRKNVGASQMKRLAAVKEAQKSDCTRQAWIDAMVMLIEKTGAKYFRIHDSGDFFNEDYFLMWLDVALKMPDVQFWAPTKEYYLANKYGNKLPDNFTLRPSAFMVNQEAPPFQGKLPTSTAHSLMHGPIGFDCPAWHQEGLCGDCRACWDKSVANTSFLLHSDSKYLKRTAKKTGEDIQQVAVKRREELLNPTPKPEKLKLTPGGGMRDIPMATPEAVNESKCETCGKQLVPPEELQGPECEAADDVERDKHEKFMKKGFDEVKCPHCGNDTDRPPSKYKNWTFCDNCNSLMPPDLRVQVGDFEWLCLPCAKDFGYALEAEEVERKAGLREAKELEERSADAPPPAKTVFDMLRKRDEERKKVQMGSYNAFCPTCDGEIDIDNDFKDLLSRKEFAISGLCQQCQDSVFEGEE